MACTNPAILTALADGDHTFTARAIDAAGNVDPSEATRAFTVDTAPPEITITAGPAGTIRQRTVTFTFASAEAGASFECHLDGAAWEACASPYTYMSVRDGEHVFGARATDAAGNVGPEAARTFRVRRRGSTPTGR